MSAVDDIARAIFNTINSTATKKILGKKAVDIIYKRTKTGQGLSSASSPNPSLRSLKGLSDKYIEQRRDANLGVFGAPSRSNLTLSGQMLEALKSRPTSEGIELYVDETARSSVVIGGRSVRQKLNNAQVASYVSEDRPFLGLIEDEKRILAVEIDNIIQRELDRIK